MAGSSVFSLGFSSSSLLLRSAVPRRGAPQLESSLPLRSLLRGMAPAVQSRSFFASSNSQQSNAGGGKGTQKEEEDTREKAKEKRARFIGLLVAAGLGALVMSFFPRSAPSQAPPPPGDPLKPDSMVLCLGEGVLQNFTPVEQIHQTVCGLHFYDGQPERQLLAHHYCSHLNEDFRQCVIYDGDGKDAKLIGIEYIISRKLFEKLPEEEKKYWHSHAYEVRSGVLVAPGVPEAAERKEMAKLVDTYGKTWHTWQVDLGHPLPLGPATLMLSLTKEGQANPTLVRAKDERTDISTEERRRKRESLEYPRTIAKGADQGFYPKQNLK